MKGKDHTLGGSTLGDGKLARNPPAETDRATEQHFLEFLHRSMTASGKPVRGHVVCRDGGEANETINRLRLYGHCVASDGGFSRMITSRELYPILRG